MRPATVYKLYLPLILSNGNSIPEEQFQKFVEEEIVSRCSSFKLQYIDGYENSKFTKYAEITIHAVGIMTNNVLKTVRRVSELYSQQFLLPPPAYVTYNGFYAI